MQRVVTLPIGYHEVQKSWIGGEYAGMVEQMLHEAKVETARDYPHLKYLLHHTMCVPDGAGVLHYTLYAGYAPKNQTTEPLNPRNLNDAKVSDQIGDPARDNAIGMKEQRF